MTFYVWSRTPDAAARIKGFASKVVGGIERSDGARANVLDDDGPLFDVVIAGTDLLVSAGLRAFLERRADGTCTFEPVTLVSKTESIEGWSLLRCEAVRKVLRGYQEVDVDALASIREPMLVAAGDESWMSELLVRDDLADAMIAEGFTGLGFRGVAGKRRAGGAKRRFPEAEILARAPRPETDIAFVSRIAAMPDAAAAWRETVARAPAEGKASVEGTTRGILSILASSPPPKKVKALWFGLGELTDGNWSIQISGSTRFVEAERYAIEWATRPAWSIRQGLSLSPFRGERSDYLHPLAMTAISVAEIARNPKGADLMRDKWLAVGWNSGDAIILGSVTAAGFVPD